MRSFSKLGFALALFASAASAQTLGPPGSSSGGGAPTGPAGGGLAGTYPNPTVATVPASALPAFTGDCTTSAGAVATTCTKTNGTAFGPAATALVGQIPGTATNDNAAAGNVGEFLDTGVVGTTTSIVSGTSLNCTSLALTAGDWDVNGVIGFTGGVTTTVQALTSGISLVTGTLPSNSSTGINVELLSGGVAFTVRNAAVPVGPTRMSVGGGGTTVFLVARADFSVSTANLSSCQLSARRRR